MTRSPLIRTKIPAEATGLKAAFYLDLEHDFSGAVTDMRISTPGKFENEQIERIMGAIEVAFREALEGITPPATQEEGR